jgi:hypothetical protein
MRLCPYESFIGSNRSKSSNGSKRFEPLERFEPITRSVDESSKPGQKGKSKEE